MDKKIRSFVSILNRCGAKTTGSCEGHVGHGAPAPWVKVTPSPAKSASILLTMKRCLDAFYAKRRVKDDVRIVVQKARFGFWIHNGGDAYDRWRAFVDDSVRKIRRGEKVRPYIDARERRRRSKRLFTYLREVSEFTRFLKATL